MPRRHPLRDIRPDGCLIIIGGREDKEDQMEILGEVARRIGKGTLVIASLASQLPRELWTDYRRIFKCLGVKTIKHLHVETHEEARRQKNADILQGAAGVFFTGGDQLKITTRIGGTPVFDRVLEIFSGGGVIAGTSAGAAAMGETMLVGSESQESHKVGNWLMAPGLGLLKETIIDQHFAQRGRIGRLLGAVSLNPGILGIGIDEDTAIMVQDRKAHVIGVNAVYVIDGRDVSYTNVTEAAAERTMSMHDVKLHILCSGESFDIDSRRPIVQRADAGSPPHVRNDRI
ncbi:MAG: cyanophycinase [Bdellovibrionota bacterium]